MEWFSTLLWLLRGSRLGVAALALVVTLIYAHVPLQIDSSAIDAAMKHRAAVQR